MKGNQKTLHRQIRSQFQAKRKIPFMATDQEKSHGRDITWTLRAIAEGFREAVEAPGPICEAWSGTSWIVEVSATGTREGKRFQVVHLFPTSLRTTPEALLQLVRDRWIHDNQLYEDAHRYRGNGAGAMATLRTAALTLLRLSGFQSIRAGIQAVMHDIKALLTPWRCVSQNRIDVEPLNQS